MIWSPPIVRLAETYRLLTPARPYAPGELQMIRDQVAVELDEWLRLGVAGTMHVSPLDIVDEYDPTQHAQVWRWAPTMRRAYLLDQGIVIELPATVSAHRQYHRPVGASNDDISLSVVTYAPTGAWHALDRGWVWDIA